MSAPTPRLKILMLHGFTQSGPFFHAKTRALEKALQKALPGTTLSYPTGPHPLRPADFPGFSLSTGPADEAEAFAWWRKRDDTNMYDGLEAGFARIAETIRREGPFDGAVGFSQGAAAAVMVAALLEEGRSGVFERVGGIEFPASFVEGEGLVQGPMKFVIEYSGFRAVGERHDGFYEPVVTTPVLHFMGAVDGLVDEKRSRALAAVCETGDVVMHPGGHFLPCQKQWLEVAIGFVKSCVGGVGARVGKGGDEEKVEDMEVPF